MSNVRGGFGLVLTCLLTRCTAAFFQSLGSCLCLSCVCLSPCRPIDATYSYCSVLCIYLSLKLTPPTTCLTHDLLNPETLGECRWQGAGTVIPRKASNDCWASGRAHALPVCGRSRRGEGWRGRCSPPPGDAYNSRAKPS